MVNMRNLIKQILKESEFDWTNEVGPMSLSNDYVIDVSVFSHQEMVWFLDDLRDLGYSGGSVVPYYTHYIYMEYTNGELVLDWDTSGPAEDPTFGNNYKMINMDLFNTMFYQWKIERDKGALHESEFEWVEDTPSFNLSKGSHWIILIDNNDELLQVEKFIRNEYGYSNYGSDGLQSDDDLFYYEDGHGGGLTAIEHDPDEGRTVDYLYDGRFAPHEYYYDRYPNALIYKWSDIQKEI